MIAPTLSTFRRPARTPADLCPTCSGELFAHVIDVGRVEILCTGCVLFDLAPGAPALCGFADADLPGPVQLLRKSDRAVYRVLRDLGGALRPADVVEELSRRTGDWVSRDTVNHSLTRLRDAGFVTHCKFRGWALVGTGRDG